MLVPLTSDEHNKLIDVLDLISTAFFKEDFMQLRVELEELYQSQKRYDIAKIALNDALYAIICERDG